MLSLPLELIVHILGFLPGEETPRFIQLNKYFATIIRKYRLRLNFPSISLKLKKCETFDDRKFMSMKIKAKSRELKARVQFYYKNMFTLDYLVIRIDEKQIKKKFFAPWIKSGDEKDLLGFLKWILSKGNISVLTIKFEMEPIALILLNEAIKAVKTRFYHIDLEEETIRKADPDLTLRGFLSTIAIKEKKLKSVPRVNITFPKQYEGDDTFSWYTVKITNQISRLFPTFILVKTERLCERIAGIVKRWEMCPFENFLFRIEVTKGKCSCCYGSYCGLLKLKERSYEIPEEFCRRRVLGNIPSTIEFHNVDVPSILRFNFTAKGENMVAEIEILA